MDAKDIALISLGKALRAVGYRFVAVTPATHRRVLDRPQATSDLQTIFGWNRPFARNELDATLFDLLAQADALEQIGGGYRAKIRFASIGDMLFVHSSFPTTEHDAVFFGPDTYRFARFLHAGLADVPTRSPLRLIDIGSGSGAGGIYATRLLPGEVELVLADLNRRALTFSAVNAAINAIPSAQTAFSDILDGIEREADLIIANPPYLVDDEQRLYRHGGGELGIALALRIVAQSLPRLRPAGRLLLYTGTPIVAGVDAFFDSVRPLVQLPGLQFVYEEIDPDVFGEELDRQAYARADRIAVVGLTVIKE